MAKFEKLETPPVIFGVTFTRSRQTFKYWCRSRDSNPCSNHLCDYKREINVFQMYPTGSKRSENGINFHLGGRSRSAQNSLVTSCWDLGAQNWIAACVCSQENTITVRGSIAPYTAYTLQCTKWSLGSLCFKKCTDEWTEEMIPLRQLQLLEPLPC